MAGIFSEGTVCTAHHAEENFVTNASWLTARLWIINVRADNASNGIILYMP
jgi:hypothetical protein